MAKRTPTLRDFQATTHYVGYQEKPMKHAVL